MATNVWWRAMIELSKKIDQLRYNELNTMIVFSHICRTGAGLITKPS